jgi:hypothetical protein
VMRSSSMCSQLATGKGSPSPRGVALSLDEFRLPLADDAEAAGGEAGVISRR